MENKAILVSFIALFAIVFALNTVMADLVEDVDDAISVWVNDRYANDDKVAVSPSEIIEVEVEFVAGQDAERVRIEASIDGYKNIVSESTPEFHIIEGKKYLKRLTLRLPSTQDLEGCTEEDFDVEECFLTEDLWLNIEISARGETDVEEEVRLTIQRDFHSLNILSVEAPSEVTVGSVVPVDVVLENNGHKRLDNTYVKVSIPELGVERKVFVGDLSPFIDADYDKIRDAVSKRAYLILPKNAAPGTYELEIEVYNYETSTIEKKTIVVRSLETGVLPTVTSKTVALGEETVFDLLLVNPNDRMVVYTLTPEQSDGLIIEILEPTVAVNADSSKTVKVRVKATNSASEGTHLIKIDVYNRENNELVEQVPLTLHVEEADGIAQKGDIVLILTVVLTIIFVVLLIILIVLLTKRPSEPEEFGETSYY